MATYIRDTSPGSFLQVRDWRKSKYPLRMIWRAIFLIYMYGGMTQAMLFYTESEKTMKAGGLEYLTLLGFIGTTVSLVLGALNEFMPFLKGVKIGVNGMFLAVETLISLLYWSLYFLDKELILDSATLTKRGPPDPYMDTAAHFIPFIAMMFEFFVSSTSKQHLYRQRCIHFTVISIFTMGYFTWIVYLFGENNDFPYPFLSHMSAEGRIAFTVFAMFLGLFVFGIMNRAYYAFHSRSDEEGEYVDERYSLSVEDVDLEA